MSNNIIETNKDTKIYNVQERTFIRKPEPKVCPACGQLLPGDVHPMRTDMAYYISGVEGSKPLCVMSSADMLQMGEVTVYRVTGKDPTGKMISKFLPTVPQPKTLQSTIK